MDAQEQLYGLMALAEEQQASVKAAISGLTQEREAITAAIDAIKATSKTLQDGTGDAAARAVRESIGQAPKAAVSALNQATEALDEAADRVRNAGAWLTFKAAASVAGVGLVLVLGMYVLGRFMLPSEAERQEVRDLRAQKAELEANITTLAKRGGKIKFSTCGGRLCIEASSNQGETAPKWSGAAWHNEQSGAALVIPRGY